VGESRGGKDRFAGEKRKTSIGGERSRKEVAGSTSPRNGGDIHGIIERSILRFCTSDRTKYRGRFLSKLGRQRATREKESRQTELEQEEGEGV